MCMYVIQVKQNITLLYFFWSTLLTIISLHDSHILGNELIIFLLWAVNNLDKTWGGVWLRWSSGWDEERLINLFEKLWTKLFSWERYHPKAILIFISLFCTSMFSYFFFLYFYVFILLSWLLWFLFISFLNYLKYLGILNCFYFSLFCNFIF